MASAQTVRIANQGDALSMDPHSLNESLQLSVTGNVYEPLVGRNKDLTLAPGAGHVSWKQTSPTVWRFELRKGVQFPRRHAVHRRRRDVHAGARVAGDGSDMKSYVNDIKEVRKINDHRDRNRDQGAVPHPARCAVHALVHDEQEVVRDQPGHQPVDRRKGIENAASFRANGTGPYRLRERQPNVRTTFVRNGNYWGKIEGNVDEVIFTPIGNDATRVAALLSGEIDVMEPVPVQDVDRIKASRQREGAAGPGTAHHLPGHGPEA